MNKAEPSQGVAWKKVKAVEKCWEVPYLCLKSSDVAFP